MNLKQIVVAILLFNTLLYSHVEAILKLDTKGHTARITDMLINKSGNIVTASNDKTIRVWNSKTGKERQRILGEIGEGVEGQIYAIALSPSEKFLVVGGFLKKRGESIGIGSIRLYDYKSGKLLKYLESHTDIINNLAFSKDEKYLISSSADASVKIWNVKDGFKLKDTITSHTNDTYAVEIVKKDGDYLAITVGYDKKISIYNIDKKKVLKEKTFHYLLHSMIATSKEIALCGKGKEIVIMDYDLNIIKTIVSNTYPVGLAYSKDGHYLIAGSGGDPLVVNVYDTKTYTLVNSFNKHKNLIKSVGFLNNKTAVSAGGNENEIYVWDIKSGKVLQEIKGVGKRVWSVGLDKNTVAWGNILDIKKPNNNATLRRFINLKTFKLGSTQKLEFKQVSTQNGDYLLSTGTGQGRVLGILKNKHLEAKMMKDNTNGGLHRCYGWSNDYVVSGGNNGHIMVYNKKGEELASLVGHTGVVWSIAIEGDRIISGSADQTIKVWDLGQLKKSTGKREIDEKILAIGMRKLKLSREKLIEYSKKHGISFYITEKLQPLLSIFISKDNEWVVWTPSGYYNASKHGVEYIGFHINHGVEHEAEFVPLGKAKKLLYRPDIIEKIWRGEELSSEDKKLTIDSFLTESGIK